MVGKTLGHYEILEPLGSGGMGEVYLGHDPRLGRKVAIKVLPAEFAADAERLARFEQEARAAAALNHPHIAVVHDVGADTAEDGTRIHYMVQEHLDGEPLGEPLKKGALPLRRALALGIEVAEALDAAHAAGIVHRDLKPGNVFVTRDGHAKVLDFGLAKLTDRGALGADASMSPTMLGTIAGQVLGTAGYMAPEQVNGEPVDRRADLFAFGCLLYEMVTGRRAFAGDNVHDTLSRIISKQPAPLRDGPGDLPERLQWIVDKALAKEPSRRYQHADDLIVDLRGLESALELEGARAASSVSAASVAREPTTVTRRGVPGAVTVMLLVLVALASALAGSTLRRDRPAEVVRFTTPPPPEGLVIAGNTLAISPDGRHIVFVGVEEGARRLFHRSLDVFETAPLLGTDFAYRPFFSPGSESVAYFVSTSLMSTQISGGQPFALCDMCASDFSDGTWSADGETIFFTNGGKLWRIPANGGEARLVAEPDHDKDEVWYSRPSALPGDDAVLLEVRLLDNAVGSARVGVLSLEGGVIEYLGPSGTDPTWASSGHILFAQAPSSLMALPFDASRRVATGDPTPVIRDLVLYSGGAGQFDVAGNGTLVYVPEGGGMGSYSFVWIDAQAGTTEPWLTLEAFNVQRPRLSPDGKRVAVEVQFDFGDRDIRVYDVERGGNILLTGEGNDFDPVWSTDGTEIVFSSNRAGIENLYMARADGGGDERPLPELGMHANAYSWHPGGDVLAAYLRDPTNVQRDIWVLSRAADWEGSELLATSANERSPAFSPDGQWLAYASDTSGRDEVYVTRYPDMSQRHLASTDGGHEPVWSPDGGAIYFRNGNQVFGVAIETAPAFRAGQPRLLFEGQYFTDFQGSGSRNYDVSPDGRFFAVRHESQEIGSVNVVLNWFEELRQRAPAVR